MEDAKYQIFISSTFLGLESVRSKITATILNLHHFPIGMEMFSAGDSEQWEIITETIDVSDYYLLIIGHRYGSVNDEGMSFTEKEFDYAVAKGIPVLSFIRERDIPTLAAERESDPDKNARLEAFIAKAKNNKMCEFWGTTDELATKVAVALPKTFKRMPRLGWKRAQEDNSKQILAELTLLSTENRDLRQKLAYYEALANESLPEIVVVVNEGVDITLDAVEHDASTDLTPPKPFDKLSVHHLAISHGLLPQHISEREIEEYNSNLPSIEVFEKYLQDLLFHKSLTTSALPLTFNIKNIGLVKASEINITISFPDLVKIGKASDTARSEAPDSPVPASPIIKHQNMMLGSAAAFSASILTKYRNLPSLLTPPDLTDVNINRSISTNKDNQIKIYLRSLLHTLDVSIGERKLILIPMKKGQGTIEIKIICEQYKQEKIINIPILVK